MEGVINTDSRKLEWADAFADQAGGPDLETLPSKNSSVSLSHLVVRTSLGVVLMEGRRW